MVFFPLGDSWFYVKTFMFYASLKGNDNTYKYTKMYAIKQRISRMVLVCICQKFLQWNVIHIFKKNYVKMHFHNLFLCVLISLALLYTSYNNFFLSMVFRQYSDTLL